MTRTTHRLFGEICTLAIIVMWMASPVLASPLDDAKAAGLIGERPDGYVGLVVESASDETRKLVDDINAKRKARYGEIAKSNDTPVSLVASQMGAKLVDRAAKDTFVMDASGAWLRR